MVVTFTHSPPAMSTGLTLWNRSSVFCAPHCPNTIYLKEKESEPTKKNNYKWRVTLWWMEHMSAKALALVFSVSFTSESWWKSSGPERACLRASWSQEWSWHSKTLSSQLRNRSKWKGTLISKSEIERFFSDSAFAFSENNIGSSNKEKTNSLMKNGKVDALYAFKDLFYEPKRSSKKEENTHLSVIILVLTRSV